MAHPAHGYGFRMHMFRRHAVAVALCGILAVLAGCTATPSTLATGATSSGTASSPISGAPDRATESGSTSGSSAPGPATRSGTAPPTGGPAESGESAAGASPGAALQRAFTSISAKVLPSVVEISTGRALGSGIVFDKAGHIVTNHHVVGDATSFAVRLSNGHSYRAKLTGDYPIGDLAVIQISGAEDLHPATFGDSSALRIGDIVLAVGNPLGLEGSVTEGIVSAVGRVMTEPSSPGSPGATLPNTIQTSAPINPGNSGGALVDLSGRVVGIPTLAATTRQEGGAAPGIGFAIPSNVVTDIAAQIVKYGEVRNSHRAALGITATTVFDQQSGAPAGVGIVKVTNGGGAAKAGLKPDEVIVSVDGQATPSTAALSQALAELKPGDQAKVVVLTRDGGHRTVTVTLGQLPG